MVALQQFMDLKLVVARVEACERVEGAGKIYKLTVDIGSEKRTLAAGVAEFYQPEELVGLHIIVVSGLDPKVVRGVESQGMLLASDTPEKPILVTVSKEIPPGTPVR